MKRGPMIRQVHGPGTLDPAGHQLDRRPDAAHVERIVLNPGATVDPDSMILNLSNPNVEQAALDADSQLKSGRGRAREHQGAAAEQRPPGRVRCGHRQGHGYEQATPQGRGRSRLVKDGLDSELNLKLAKVTAAAAETLNEIQKKRYLVRQGFGRPADSR